MIKYHSLLLHLVFMTATIHLSTQQEQCQRVLTNLQANIPHVAYNGIQPDLTGCNVRGGGDLDCPGGGVLGDGDIGPLYSVDVSDSDQVHQFYVWHQSNVTVELEFQSNPIGQFDISYINIYTLINTAAGIGVPSSPSVVGIPGGIINVVSQQNCAFSSDTSTVMRTTLDVGSRTVTDVVISFSFTVGSEIEWLFLSEVELCQGTAPSSITCDTPPTPTPQPTPSPSPSPSPTSPPPPTITLSSPPPTGVSVTPDPSSPGSVSLTCSVSSPTDGYQYQWQWWRSGAELSNDGRFIITTPQDRSGESTLTISGLQYSDAGEYMCTVEYAVCPDEVQCSSATGTFQLNLPVYVQVETPMVVYAEDTDHVDLVCEVYGYPRNSSLLIWANGTDVVQSGNRTTITVSNTNRINSESISVNERVASVLSIVNVTEYDTGEYTCNVTGNSSTVTLTVNPGSRPVSTSSNAGLIAGVVIAILIFLIVLGMTLAVILWMVCRYLRNNHKWDSWWESFCAAARAKMPSRRAPSMVENGSTSSMQRRYTADDIEVQVYSAVVKKKTMESPPPLPPQTFTETELNELMKKGDDSELPSKPRARVSTALSTYSYSGSSPPRLAKITNLKNFKMKDNPLYESADEMDLDLGEFNVYAMPSQPDASSHPGSHGETADPIYSEAIDPSMFSKRTSKYVAEEELHPYGPVYAQPSQLIKKVDPPLEIGESNIREIKRLGIGQFGAVILAEIVGLKSSDLKLLPKQVDPEAPTQVAVKRLKPDVSDEVRKNFDKEIKFMSQLRHENIVQLLAVCTNSTNPFIAMEYMENGDLNQFLQKYQLLEDDVAIYSNQLPPSVLVYMAIQIASGMCYLASLNYVHRDLATRNCLVGTNFLVKISDFGMSRNLYEHAYYRVRGRAMLPIRWMATESFYGRFSEKSDVWAYGVAMWEVFTLGKKQPYEELDDQEMIQDAIRGMGRRIMNKPPGCPQAVYEVMLRCWEYAAEDRATFKEIHKSLLDIQQQI